MSPEDLFDSKKPSKFCCSNDHKELLQLLGSNLSIIPTNSTPVKCGDNKCLSGAVGCMSHAKEKFSDPVQILHNHDYISPVGKQAPKYISLDNKGLTTELSCFRNNLGRLQRSC